MTESINDKLMESLESSNIVDQRRHTKKNVNPAKRVTFNM